MWVMRVHYILKHKKLSLPLYILENNGKIITLLVLGWTCFFVYFCWKRERRAVELLSAVLGSRGPKKRLWSDRVWLGNVPKVRGHLTKYCSSIDPLTCLVSFSKSRFHFHAAVFLFFRRFYHHPHRLLQRFFLPVYILLASSQPSSLGVLV